MLNYNGETFSDRQFMREVRIRVKQRYRDRRDARPPYRFGDTITFGATQRLPDLTIRSDAFRDFEAKHLHAHAWMRPLDLALRELGRTDPVAFTATDGSRRVLPHALRTADGAKGSDDLAFDVRSRENPKNGGFVESGGINSFSLTGQEPAGILPDTRSSFRIMEMSAMTVTRGASGTCSPPEFASLARLLGRRTCWNAGSGYSLPRNDAAERRVCTEARNG